MYCLIGQLLFCFLFYIFFVTRGIKHCFNPLFKCLILSFEGDKHCLIPPRDENYRMHLGIKTLFVPTKERRQAFRPALGPLALGSSALRPKNCQIFFAIIKQCSTPMAHNILH